MGRALTYYLILNELGEDEEFIDKAISLLSEVDKNSIYTTDNAVAGILNYWLSRDELTCYQDGFPIFNEDVKGGIVYGVNGGNNEIFHRLLTFDSQELTNKLKNEGFNLPFFLQEMMVQVTPTRLKVNIKTIDWNDWLNRKQITFDDALLLSMGQNPDNFDEDVRYLDKYAEFFQQAQVWIREGRLKCKPTLTNEGVEEYQDIEPTNFFNQARLNHWFLPNEVHVILDEWKIQQNVTLLGDEEPTETQTKSLTKVEASNQKQDDRENQLHILIWRIYQSLSAKSEVTAKVTAQKTWRELQNNYKNYDTDKIIQEVTGEKIDWCSSYRNEQTLKRSSFDAALSKLKKIPPF